MSADVSNPRRAWPFRAPVERGTVDVDKPAKCVGCGCTDQRACPGGCTWLAVDRAAGDGVCSNCSEHLGAWNARREAQERRHG